MNFKNTVRARSVMVVTMSLFVSIVAARAESGPDWWTSVRVKADLNVAEGARASAINVDTVYWHVTLRGQVPSQEMKTRVGEQARSVVGVVGMRNLIQVVPARRAAPVPVPVRSRDQIVMADIQRARLADRSLNGSEAFAPASEATTLRGPLAVQPLYTRDYIAFRDEEIRQGVVKAISDLDNLDNETIHVSVSDGVVSLNGTVPTRLGSAATIDAARSVAGVRSVVDSVRLVPMNFDTR